MLLDSGADVTLLPSAFVNQLGVAPEADTIYELMAFDGNVSLASAVQLEMLFLNKTFRGRFLVLDEGWGVIGRDVLNHLTLLLDGPNLSWDEQKRVR
ncbi:MAG: retropepsin-like domain-containing protein [Anaerolineae bacterium]|nr:retropepsin-like domain-containing protein [Anaerolineae bacterium]MCO5190844.1 retropepsin-like domain-containing protein [Anaerolineae bacterium]